MPQMTTNSFHVYNIQISLKRALPPPYYFPKETLLGVLERCVSSLELPDASFHFHLWHTEMLL